MPKALSEQEKLDGAPSGRVPICPSCREGLLKPDGAPGSKRLLALQQVL